MSRPTVSICTPWRDNIQFIPLYLEATKGADEVIIVDGGCSPDAKRALMAAFGSMAHLSGPFAFSRACNKGLQFATGDIVVMLNNDVRAVGPWLDLVRASVKRGALYGPEMGQQHVYSAGVLAPYISGWCIAARREVWQELGGFDGERFHGGYWEDNDLCFRAIEAGFNLLKADWPIVHLGNGTSGLHGRETPETLANKAAFHSRVVEAMLGRRATA